MGHFSAIWLISLGKVIRIFTKIFTTNVPWNKEVPVKFWKSSGSEVRMQLRTPDPDHILLDGRMRSPTALVEACVMWRKYACWQMYVKFLVKYSTVENGLCDIYAETHRYCYPTVHVSVVLCVCLSVCTLHYHTLAR